MFMFLDKKIDKSLERKGKNNAFLFNRVYFYILPYLELKNKSYKASGTKNFSYEDETNFRKTLDEIGEYIDSTPKKEFVANYYIIRKLDDLDPKESHAFRMCICGNWFRVSVNFQKFCVNFEQE